MIVRVDIQPPHHLFFPRRQRSGADGLDIHQRHQAQHLEPFLGTHQFREAAHHRWIHGVTLERDARHLKVLTDQELDVLAALGRDAEALQHRARHANAFVSVVVILPFTDIVEEQRQHQ